MANTFSQVYVQCVFAVKYRDAIIHKEWRQTLLGVIGNLINETGCKTIIVNGVEDHVHCFVGLKPILSISELMKEVKAKSSKYINDHHLVKRRFEWQEGYGVFSYGHSQIDDVFKYISNQEIHHKKQTFREEYLEFLEKFEVPYDERYIFADLI
jgi:putative transposase